MIIALNIINSLHKNALLSGKSNVC